MAVTFSVVFGSKDLYDRLRLVGLLVGGYLTGHLVKHDRVRFDRKQRRVGRALVRVERRQVQGGVVHLWVLARLGQLPGLPGLGDRFPVAGSP